MKADISRDTFHAARDIRRVIAQQGRPWLDADWNEQMSVLLHRLETLATDILGDHRAIGRGFMVEVNRDSSQKPIPRTFAVVRGRYYIHGLMCENDENVPVDKPDEFQNGQSYLVYLHAWEEYESAVEDPSIGEPALRGVDTSGRTRVRWEIGSEKATDLDKAWDNFRDRLEAKPARLKIHLRPTTAGHDSSRLDGRAVYRGSENTLYRVEAHEFKRNDVRLKWARNNAATLIPVVSAGGQLRCESPDDLDESFESGRWVEVHQGREQDAYGGGTLHTIASVDRDAGTITLSPAAEATGPLFLRPWSGLLETKGGWVPLEHGLEISLDPAANQPRPGQYWLIPVRTDGNGQVYWPTDARWARRAWQSLDGDMSKAPSAAPEAPDLSTPEEYRKGDTERRRHHYYGPLAVITFDGAGLLSSSTGIRDLREPFTR